MNVGCGTARRRPGPSVTLREAWINSLDPLPTRIPSSVHPANFARRLEDRRGHEFRVTAPGSGKNALHDFPLQLLGKFVRILVLVEFDFGIKMLERVGGRPRTSGFMTPDSDRSRMCRQSLSNGKLFNHFAKSFDGAA